MSAGLDTSKKSDLKSRVIQRLRDPLQLKVFVTAVVLGLGYTLVFMPLDSQIVETTRQLKHEERLLNLARDIEHLQKEYDRFEKRLPKQSDAKEWVAYVLEGIRQYPLKLVAMDCEAPRNVGPYTAVVMRIELEGTFPSMDKLLCWVETNERLFRIDSMRIAPSRSSKDVLVLQITLLGVMG